MDDREQHKLALASATLERQENQLIRDRVKKTVQEERRRVKQQVRSIRIFNLKYEAGAKAVAQWFFRFGTVLSVQLMPNWNCKEGKSNRPHSGMGVVEFATSNVVDALETLPHMRVDPSGQCVLSSILGKNSCLKFQRHISRRAYQQTAEEESLLFKTNSLQLGNLLGKSTAVYGLVINSTTEVRLFARGLTWELQHQGNRYRCELAFKYVSGRAGVQPLEGARAALLLPVWIPPKIYRLPLSQPKDRAAIEQAVKLVSAAANSTWFTNADWDDGLLTSTSSERQQDGSSSRGNGLAMASQRSSAGAGACNWTSQEAGSDTATERMHWNMDPEKWIRTTDFTLSGEIGSSFLYRFVLPYTVEELWDVKNNVLGPLWNAGILQDPIYFNPEDMTHKYVENFEDVIDDMLAALPYNVRYHLECLISAGYIIRQQLQPEFMSILMDGRIPPEVVIQALCLMLAARCRVANPVRGLRKLIQDILDERRDLQELSRPLPEHCMLVGRALVTPTRIVRLTPETELSNRVLRHFRQHSDRFIRVSFGEENARILHLGPRANMNLDLKHRMEQVLKQGITIAGRFFEFLAFSASQLREHSVWFFAPLPELSTNAVRSWMGDFDNIRCVAKYAARMGQCFSSTLDTVEVREDEVQDIADIERNGYTFSEGCGLISTELANLVANFLKQHGSLNPQIKSNPNAYQLRFGGCKGVVVVYPGDPRLTGRKMLVRPSMRKFESSNSRRIEVVQHARFLPAFLNRQIISILFQKSAGIPDKVFKELQDAMLEDLNGMLHDDQMALHVLKDYASVENENQVNGMIAMISAGFHVAKECYLHGMLTAIRSHLLQDLKNKTRIYVPEAALLMGVVDELGILEYGQVFIQLDRSALLDTAEVVTGNVIVAKNPCFHPGDVKCLQAVHIEQLEHLRNVVVFPQKGRRPHPNEISGSDLDGDNYFCCWRQNLIPPPHRRNAEAMEFPPAVPKELDEAVSIHDVAELFVDHVICDNLGIIANAHLALSDISPEGVHNPKCIALAHLHSQAVDFPKTGIVVDVPRELRPARYPDFMQNKFKDVYPSQTIIGVLFREIQEPVRKSLVSQGKTECCEFDDDLIVEGYQQYKNEAQRHRIEYEQQLIMIMNQFNVWDEFQLVTGCITQLDKMQKRRNGKRFDTRTHVTEATQALRKKFLRIFEAGIQEEDQDDGARKVLSRAKASACYYVTYHHSCEKQGSDADLKLYSFAWVVDKYLAEIKRSVGVRNC